MADKIINPARGQFGYTALVDQLAQRNQEFAASTTVTANSVAALNTSGSAYVMLTNASTALSVGVFAESGTSTDQVDVTTQGVAQVWVNGTVTAGSIVKPSTTTAGRVVVTATPAAGEALGVAIDGTTITTGSCAIWVSKSL